MWTELSATCCRVALLVTDTPDRLPIVVDIHIFVDAFIGAGRRGILSWPNPPPASGNPEADCMGVLVDGREFSLWLSRHVLRNVAIVLAEELYGDEKRITQTIEYLIKVAKRSGGGVLEPHMKVAECVADFEDNRILEVAASCEAVRIVSNDPHLTDISPWKGTIIQTADKFVKNVDVTRRGRRGRR